MASVLRGHACNPPNMATEYRGHGTHTGTGDSTRELAANMARSTEAMAPEPMNPNFRH